MTRTGKFSGCPVSSHTCKCMGKLTDEDCLLIESKSAYLTYKRGEIICKQCSLSSHVMMIEDGLVKVFLEQGVNSIILKLATRGSLLGLSSFNEGSNVFPYSAIALSETKIKQIDLNTFHKVLSRNGEFSKEIIEMLAANSEQVNRRFFSLFHKQSYGRIADILLCLSDRIFKAKFFELPISRQDIAELTGMSGETAIRILKKFHDDGLIKMDGKTLEILEYEKLSSISETG